MCRGFGILVHVVNTVRHAVFRIMMIAFIYDHSCRTNVVIALVTLSSFLI